MKQKRRVLLYSHLINTKRQNTANAKSQVTNHKKTPQKVEVEVEEEKKKKLIIFSNTKLAQSLGQKTLAGLWTAKVAFTELVVHHSRRCMRWWLKMRG